MYKKHDIVPNVFAMSQYTDIGYFPMSGRLHDVRDDMSPAAASAPHRPHWPGAPTGPASESESAQALQLEQARSTVEFSSLLEM